jgi:excisionase family DNA binding protein
MSAFEPLTLSPEKAAEYCGLSRRTISRLLADKLITARRSGSRTLVDCASLRAYVASLPPYVPGAAIPCAPHLQKRAARRKVKS